VNQKYRQFAGSVGGPIIKDHLFFFASYEACAAATRSFNRAVKMETPQFEKYVIQQRPTSIAAKIFQTPDSLLALQIPGQTTDFGSLDGRPLGTLVRARNRNRTGDRQRAGWNSRCGGFSMSGSEFKRGGSTQRTFGLQHRSETSFSLHLICAAGQFCRRQAPNRRCDIAAQELGRGQWVGSGQINNSLR